MIFVESELRGAFLVQLEPLTDQRGFFARSFCADEFAAHGLRSELVQCSVSFNHKRGTLRGMHHQGEPRPEEKLVRCTRGAVFDVLADLRKASPTYGRWCSYELSADNRHALYVPAGVAHGFQTLTDGAEVFYQMSVAYHAPSQRGVRFDDPTLAIRWPLPDPIVSERDRALPLLENA